METKKLTPRNAAPVQRENTATVSDNASIRPSLGDLGIFGKSAVFAGDDAE